MGDVMETKTRIERLSDEEFQRKYGVNRKTFEAMEEVLQKNISKTMPKVDASQNCQSVTVFASS
jgi:hypothetical protein